MSTPLRLRAGAPARAAAPARVAAPARAPAPPLPPPPAPPPPPGRRGALAAGVALLLAPVLTPLHAAATNVIHPDLAPDQSRYDAADPRLRAAARLLQDALSAPDVAAEERLWTRLIDEYGADDAPWADDLVGRALGNRGNARARQGRLDAALADYDAAAARCPWAVDPILNRGVAYEALGRFDLAAEDYRAVLAAAPDDPAGYNNLANAEIGLGEWAAAERHLARAVALAPRFSFAAASHAVVLYQMSTDDAGAERELRTLLRRFPAFDDARAALAALQWNAGRQGEAEGEWARVDDPRYGDPVWLKEGRRWPPRLVAGLSALLAVKDVKA